MSVGDDGEILNVESIVKQVYVFDMETEVWTQVANMPSKRYRVSFMYKEPACTVESTGCLLKIQKISTEC